MHRTTSGWALAVALVGLGLGGCNGIARSIDGAGRPLALDRTAAAPAADVATLPPAIARALPAYEAPSAEPSLSSYVHLCAASPEDPPPTPTPAPGSPPDVIVRPPTSTPGPAPVYVPSYGPVSEQSPVGPYGQPEWTTQRRFSTVRAYVLAPWQVELETWWRGRWPNDGGDPSHRFQQEIGIGLPHRFQFDVYANVEDKPDEGTFYSGTQLELRWALANWGCLPLNPTLYAEYKIQEHDQHDVFEGKLLLAEDWGCRWAAGVNLVYEQELGGEDETVYEVTAGISYSLIDKRLSIGAEAKYESATVEGARDDPEKSFYLGPSVQVRFSDRTHLDVTPLFGMTDDSRDLEMFVVFGIDLGCGVSPSGGYSPVSTRSR